MVPVDGIVSSFIGPVLVTNYRFLPPILPGANPVTWIWRAVKYQREYQGPLLLTWFKSNPSMDK